MSTALATPAIRHQAERPAIRKTSLRALAVAAHLERTTREPARSRPGRARPEPR